MENSWNLDKLKKTVFKLNQTIEEVKKLLGLLPICSYCKNIKDSRGYWHEVEAYVSKATNISFTHSLCPNCVKKLYPDLMD